MDERFEREVRMALAEHLFPAHGEHPIWAASPAAARVASPASERAGDDRRHQVVRRARTWWSVFVPPADRSPALRLAWLVALVALLLAVTASGLYVGSELLRRAEELAVVPAVTPAPSGSPVPTEDPWAFEPVGEPIVSDTALGTITWQIHEGYPFDVSTPYGPVGIGEIDDTELGWLGPDGTVERTALPAGDVYLAPVGDGLIAYGTPQGYGQDQAWPISWDGSRWVVGDELDVPPFLLGGAVHQVAAGPSGVLIVGIDVAVAPDGQHFVRVPKPPGGYDQIGPAFATADGFIALVSPGRRHTLTNDPPFEPVPWFSADGLTWEPMTSSSPFGERSWVRDVASRDGRFVAVGNIGNVDGDVGGVNGAWAVWLSDDGRTWERLADLELGQGQDQVCAEWADDCSIAVTAGDAAWVISTGAHRSLWASADGRAWERLTPPAAISMEEFWGFLPQLAPGGDTIVVFNIASYSGRTSAVGTIEP